jgi:RimJ/RimL family protein N-acetyltransferase
MEYIDIFITKSGKEVKFRYPTIDDAEILKNYINEISLEETFILMQGVQKTLRDEIKWIRNFLKNPNKTVIILAFVGEKLIGVSDISLKDEAKKHIGSFGITITKEFRGDGVGEKLMGLVISESIKNIKDLKIIELEVFGQNKIAQNLYRKLGFIEYGKLPKSLKRHGQFDDAIYMYKKI